VRAKAADSEATRAGAPTAALRAIVLAAAIVVGALVGTSPTLGALLVSVAFLVLIVAVKPDWATIAAVVLLYSNAAVVANRFHGLPQPVAQGAALLVAIALAHHLGVKGRPFIVPAALPWIVAFFVVQMVGLVGASDPGAAVESILDFIVSGLFLYVAFTNAIRSEAVLRQTLWAVLIVAAVLGGIAFHQSATQNWEQQYLGFAQVGEAAIDRIEETPSNEEPTQPRAEGPIGEKNRFGQLLFAAAPIGLMLFVGHPVRSRRWLALGLTGMVLIGAALTISRGGAVAFALTLLLLTSLRYVPVRHLLVALVGILLLLSATPRLMERLSTLGSVGSLVSEDGPSDEVDGSTMGRMGANVAALRVFAAHPIVGVGPGMFNVHYREQAIEAGFRVHSDTRSPHNMILQIMAEYGLLGAIALFGGVAITLRDLHRARRRCVERRPELAAFLGGAFGALICYLAAGVFLSYSYVRFFWFLLAVASAAVTVAARATGDGPRFGLAGTTHRDALVGADRRSWG
jgi:putative inorganic carbon (hco3(-)) transporter